MSERTYQVTLTDAQRWRLETYLRTTTKYRDGERDACLSLAQERNDDGSLKFPNMVKNAGYWQETIELINEVMTAIDNATCDDF